MLEKPNRKKIDKQDGNMPTNIEQLIQKYDLEKVWPYIEDIIENLNGINIKDLAEFIDIYKDVFDINNKNVAIGQKYDASKGGKLQVNGDTYIHKNSGITSYKSQRTDTGTSIWFGVGNSGVQHGVYSEKLNKWIVYADDSNCYLNGEAEKVKINNRDTTNTWIPIISSGKLNYTTRYMPNAVTHSQYNTEQDRLVTLNFMSFWNGAYSANGGSNLQYCYQGTIQAKPKTLYDNSSGSNGTITLNESAANFSYLEIHYFSDLNNDYGSVKIGNPNREEI